MDWRAFLTTFAAVFLAEVGDKTQLATLSFAAASRSFWGVFLGSSLALVSTSLIAVVVGSVLHRFLPTRWVHLGAGVLFIVIGVVMVVRNLAPPR